MGMRPVTATMVQATGCWARTVGSLVRSGAPRHTERSGAFENSVSGSVRVVAVNSRFAFGRIAVQYRRCRDGASCSGCGPPSGVHTDGQGKDGAMLLWRSGPHRTRGIDACQPTPCATPCRVRIATHRRVACQHRTAGCGWRPHDEWSALQALRQSSLRLQPQTKPVAARLRRHAVCAASPLPWH
jgi:hypothetical protein